MTTDAAIRVRDLEKSYKELRVLRGVDSDVARGSVFALLGANGAGKTTVVHILSTLLKADAGTATVDGFGVATQPASVRESISLTGGRWLVSGRLSAPTQRPPAGRQDTVTASRSALRSPATLPRHGTGRRR